MWWVYYEAPGGTLFPADDDHAGLVAVVNELKQQVVAGTEGGAFSLTEHQQVIARMPAPAGLGQSVYCIGVDGAEVCTYRQPLLFDNGRLDPRVEPRVGAIWAGPLCGSSYTFAASGSIKPPSVHLDEIFTEIDGARVVLSGAAMISPYPPASGVLFDFLSSLRNFLPCGGRFRVNEYGRAFTARTHEFIGTAPLAQWFTPLTPTS